jgi:hypothetical protein
MKTIILACLVPGSVFAFAAAAQAGLITGPFDGRDDAVLAAHLQLAARFAEVGRRFYWIFDSDACRVERPFRLCGAAPNVSARRAPGGRTPELDDVALSWDLSRDYAESRGLRALGILRGGRLDEGRVFAPRPHRRLGPIGAAGRVWRRRST